MQLNDDEIAKAIGARIRYRRDLAGMSQKHLGQHLGMTFQQVQKYEAGTNRIAAIYLVKLAEIFGCRPEDFLPRDDEPVLVMPSMTIRQHRLAGRLARAILAVKSPRIQQSMVDLIESLSKARAMTDAEISADPAPSGEPRKEGLH